MITYNNVLDWLIKHRWPQVVYVSSEQYCEMLARFQNKPMPGGPLVLGVTTFMLKVPLERPDQVDVSEEKGWPE